MGCHCLLHKNGIDVLICKEKIETDVENKHMDTKVGMRGGMNWETGINVYTL